MKKRSFLTLMALPFLLVACNGVNPNEHVVAKVKNEKIFQEDLDLIMHAMGVNRENNEYKKNVEEGFLDAALVSDIVAENPQLQKDWENYRKNLDDRLLTITYQRYYAQECLMYPDSVLRRYFDAHKDKFGGDTAVFMDVRKKVAERVFFEDNADSLNEYIKQNIKTKDVPARLDMFHFEGTKAEAEKMLALLDTAQNPEKIEGFAKGYARDDFQSGILKNKALEPFLFGDSMVLAGQSKLVALSDTNLFMAFKVTNRVPRIIADVEMFRTEFENNYVYDYRQKVVRQLSDSLWAKYGLKIEKIEPPEPKAFYEQSKSKFMRSAGYEVYHVQSKDSSALAKLFAEPVASLDGFKEIATKNSENKWTAANGGYVGEVLVDHALPYGIGLLPAMFSEFDGKSAGYVSGVIRSESSDYHVFYLAKSVAAEQKPFERVEAMAKIMLDHGIDYPLDSNYVLANENGKPLVQERDVLNLYEEEPGIIHGNRARERIVYMLTECHAFAQEARLMHLDESWEYLAMVRHARRNYIVDNYKTLFLKNHNISDDSLKSVYDKVGNPFRRGLSFEDSKSDLIEYLVFPENSLKREYYYAIFLNKGESFEANRPRLVLENISRERELRKERLQAKAWDPSKVVFYADPIEFNMNVGPAQMFVAKADSLYKAQKIESAITALKRIRELYPENDSLFAYATFNIAQMQSESEEDFDLAQSEYFTYYRMWPDSPDAEKAMFSRGFILNENLHRDNEALEALEEFQKKYPKSELKESVDWLVDNIKSGGKLADDLMKKISEE
ncbi:MAG: tetratricopeptide repeat protein [Fibrobacter sp.]|nr:tetratricopeptide repeat protein [Fibrobacter sp.]